MPSSDEASRQGDWRYALRGLMAECRVVHEKEDDIFPITDNGKNFPDMYHKLWHMSDLLIKCTIMRAMLIINVSYLTGL
jgi:hypothetical protein